MIDNMTLSTSEHMEQFYDAARWFVTNQNVTSGGWPNPVRRKVASGMAILEPGWYPSWHIFTYIRITVELTGTGFTRKKYVVTGILVWVRATQYQY